MPARHKGNAKQKPAGAREALLKAGLELFGQKGFDNTSTRELAAISGVNSALISYHFGSKEGLRTACAKAITERMRNVAGGGLIAAGAETDPDRAAIHLKTAIGAMLKFLLTAEDARPIAAFILREIANPGPALDLIYVHLIAPVHEAACRLFAAAAGAEAESAKIRIAVFALIGQAVYFRLAQPVVQRRLGWSRIGENEAGQIAAIICANLDAVLDHARREKS